MAIKKLILSEMDLNDLVFILNKYTNLNGGNYIDIDTLGNIGVNDVLKRIKLYNTKVIKWLITGVERDSQGTSLIYIHKTIGYLIKVINKKMEVRSR